MMKNILARTLDVYSTTAFLENNHVTNLVNYRIFKEKRLLQRPISVQKNFSRPRKKKTRRLTSSNSAKIMFSSKSEQGVNQYKRSFYHSSGNNITMLICLTLNSFSINFDASVCTWSEYNKNKWLKFVLKWSLAP